MYQKIKKGFMFLQTKRAINFYARKVGYELDGNNFSHSTVTAETKKKHQIFVLFLKHISKYL